MKRIFSIICLISIVNIVSEACTSAIIGADMNPYGRPLLWKNRDTSTTDNKIEYVEGDKDNYSYVALFNAKDSKLNEAWIGMNEYGFGIMNTASYNIKNDDLSSKKMDKEGFIMAKALKKCKTVEDFAALLESLPKPLGVEANFGVIDAYGNGAYFETNNYTFTPYYLADAPDHVIVRTNYSHSGRQNEGYGFIREANANHLLEPYIKAKNITPEVLTEVLSKSFYHDLLKKDFAETGEKWVIDQDFIPRFTSTATVVVEGCRPLEEGSEIMPDEIIKDYIMWSGLGYPPCAEIFPVFCEQDGVAEELTGCGPKGHSPQGDIVKARKEEVFPFTKGNGNKYIDMEVLINDEGTGYIQTLVPKNLETYRLTRKQRRGED